MATQARELVEDYAARSPAGRKTKYRPEFVEIARQLSQQGATDKEVYDFLGISHESFYVYRNAYPEFAAALAIGREPSNKRVEKSMYDRAVGYTYTEQRAFKIKLGDGSEDVKVVDIERYQPGDNVAGMFYLKNRAGWREKAEVEVSVSDARTIDPRRLDPDQREMLKQLLLAASASEVEGEFTEADQGDE